MTYEAVLTDTFGGEPNYAIVYRAEFTGTGQESSRQLALRARKALEERYSIRMPSLRTTHDGGDSILYACKGHNLCVIVEAMHG